MCRRALPLVLILFLLPLTLLCAQSATPEISPSTAHFDPAQATKAWLATVPAAERAKSDAYFEGGYWLILWNFLVGAAISIFLLQSHISARLRDFAERRTRCQAMRVILYAIPVFAIFGILSFPLEWYQSFYREHQYGMATQTFVPWFAQELISFVVTLVISAIALVILYAVFRRAPRTWPIWGTIAAVCLSIFVNLIAPVFLEPLFNNFKPLEDPKIRDPILAMARANQIPADKVYIYDASRQTNRVGAHVSGLLGTTQISLADNLISRCTLPEIRETMAHEMGHYVLNHGAKLTTYFGILALAAFVLCRIAFDRSLQKWGPGWNVRGIDDLAGFPLLVLIFSTYIFLVTPITNTITRVTEREADAFSINTCREPEGAAMVDLKLGQYRKLDPGPIEEFIFYDHPSGRARIRMAMDWKAAHLPCGQVQ